MSFKLGSVLEEAHERRNEPVVRASWDLVNAGHAEWTRDSKGELAIKLTESGLELKRRRDEQNAQRPN